MRGTRAGRDTEVGRGWHVTGLVLKLVEEECAMLAPF